VRRAVVGALLALAWLSPSLASEDPRESVDTLGEQAEAAVEVLGDRRSFVMPVPIANPTIGTGLGAIAMRLFQAGENAPASNLTLAGFWADSHSWAGAAGGEVHLEDDDWRLSGWVGHFDANLKFYGIGNGAGDRGEYVNINQWGPFVAPRALRRIAGNWYLGAQYRFARIRTAFSSLPDWVPGDLASRNIEVTTSGAGIVLEHDSRDNRFNPHEGSYLHLVTNVARRALGSDRDYEQYTFGYNHYFELGKDRVLAWRATACGTGGDAPFYDLCLFGGMTDAIRGYVGGQYRDKISLTTQVEYRWKLSRKWGVAGFAGMGQVAPSLSDFTGSDILPSYGVGARYLVSEEQRINLAVDYARGRDSDAWYFRIAEAF
jgi:hypothetical protein